MAWIQKAIMGEIVQEKLAPPYGCTVDVPHSDASPPETPNEVSLKSTLYPLYLSFSDCLSRSTISAAQFQKHSFVMETRTSPSRRQHVSQRDKSVDTKK